MYNDTFFKKTVLLGFFPNILSEIVNDPGKNKLLYYREGINNKE